jgi:RNA polymerase sigma factor (sigma-70 family)
VTAAKTDETADLGSITAELHAGRQRFLELVADIRPDLHRYCARMTGSVSAGEDVVQETLARAYYALGEIYALPPLRSWLFQIAHQRSIDYLRRYDRRMSEPLEESMNMAADGRDSPEDTLAREEAVRLAISAFLQLAPAQRSCVILKDVLGYSVDEIAPVLELTVPAVKAALHRGRERLREGSLSSVEEAAPVSRAASPAVTRYARLFNARDWDGVRAMLAEDVRLDLVSRSKRAGKAEVAGYVTQYAAHAGWRFAPAWLDGREVIAAFRNHGDQRPGYYIELAWRDGLVTGIRDFRYVSYIAQEAAIILSDSQFEVASRSDIPTSISTARSGTGS